MHVAANGKIFILSYGSVVFIYIYKYLYHVFSTHSSIDVYLGCFHVLDVVDNSAMNRRMHVCFQISVFVFFVSIPRSEIARS